MTILLPLYIPFEHATPSLPHFSNIYSSRQQAAVYRFPLKKTKEEREREKSIIDSQRVISASQQSKVDQVTHNLVQWVQDLVSNH